MKKYSIIMLFFIILVLILFGLEKRPINAQTVAPEPISVIDRNEFEFQFPVYDIPLSITTQELIFNECQKYNLSESLVYAIIQTESNFNNTHVSNTGDYGLFQLNKGTYPWIAKALEIKNFNPLNKTHNIKAGIYYINYLSNYWQSQGLCDEDVFTYTIVSYNRGVGGCKTLINRGTVERNKYYRTVVKNKYNLENQ